MVPSYIKIYFKFAPSAPHCIWQTISRLAGMVCSACRLIGILCFYDFMHSPPPLANSSRLLQ